MSLAKFLLGAPPSPNAPAGPPRRPGVDPAFVTLAELYRHLNPEDVHHPPSSYDWPVERMAWIQRQEYPHHFRRLSIAGLEIEIRYKREHLRYVRLGPNGEPVRGPGGRVEHLSDEEALASGRPVDEYTFVAFDGERAVGKAVDEWGCWLIAVAREYRGMGIGTELQRIAREHDPDRPSGGFTERGARGLVRVHGAAVADALADGRYSRAVRSGAVGIARVRSVIASARSRRPPPEAAGRPLLSPGGPEEWLMRADGDGWFTVYSRRLAALIQDGWSDSNRYFMDRMILGAAGCHVLSEQGGGRDPAAIVVLFGGDSAPVRRLLLSLLATHCAEEGARLHVDPDMEADVEGSAVVFDGPDGVTTGYRRRPVTLAAGPVAWRPMAEAERRWRRAFDRYGEFGNHLLELAHAKYRREG